MKIGSIVIDCNDFDKMLAFWQEALHYVPIRPPKDGWVILCDPEGNSPNISLNQVPEKHSGRNRLHIDFYTDNRESEVNRLLKIGAKHHPQTYDPDDDFRVLEDPDGNLFCVVQKDMNLGNDFRGYAKVITDFPEADIQFKGIKAWILQGETHQLVFFQMEANARVPEHSHDYAQWGMVIEGEMELIIEGKTRNCKKGDEYLIPARAKHKARFLKKSRVIDLFSERTRYRTKSVT